VADYSAEEQEVDEDDEFKPSPRRIAHPRAAGDPVTKRISVSGWDRGFESGSLQRRVCKPSVPLDTEWSTLTAQVVVGPLLGMAAQTPCRNRSAMTAGRSAMVAPVADTIGERKKGQGDKPFLDVQARNIVPSAT
jgi:hypothetical protein